MKKKEGGRRKGGRPKRYPWCVCVGVGRDPFSENMLGRREGESECETTRGV